METTRRKLKRLLADALRSAKFRGHKMKVISTSSTSIWAECSVCEKQLQVETNPPPNGIDIGGEAVALRCND